ncbi:MAG: methyltransferase domain-containing protein [Proteobacteria bacterium]|nr:methyltransferase domain-containing protein [Pseudomonadota bacterium]MCP4921631.1 methyltransferase domain-containing protein [Pseudomonadota bacterium]
MGTSISSRAGWVTEPRKLGQWPTPDWLVEAVLDTVELPAQGTVLDPACGDGRWLEAVHRRNPALELIGWDIAPQAVAAARERLGDRAELVCRSALTGDERNVADWVVGNPPFIRPQHLDADTRAHVWECFASATDKVDLYAPFTERMLELAPSVAIVLGDTWLSLASYEAFRDLLEPRIDLVAPVPRDAFTATVGCVALVCRPDGRQRLARLDRAGLHDVRPLRRVDGVYPLVDTVDLEGDGLLGDRLQLRMGVVCGSYSEFVHDGPPAIGDVRTCRGKQVHRFRFDPSAEWLRYRPREMLDRRPYVAPKSRALFDVPEKVVLAGTSGGRLRCAVDTERRYPLDSCYVSQGAEDVWALCGLLNSSLVSSWYGPRFPAPRVKAVELHRLPWPVGDLSRVAEAARASDQDGVDAAVREAYRC